MTPAEETAFEAGQRALWLRLLSQGLHELGYGPTAPAPGPWVLEREALVALLRQICATYGDNDWNDTAWLPDVLEKHLWKHLEYKKPS